MTDASIDASARTKDEEVVEVLQIDYQAILNDSPLLSEGDLSKKVEVPRYAAETDEERRAERGLRYLAHLSDATVINGVTVQKTDIQMGRSLIDQLVKRGGLTRKQWVFGHHMCQKYRKQVEER
jgi:hypothetical protein